MGPDRVAGGARLSVDPSAAVAIGLVALAVVVAAAAWRHRRGGLRLDVRLWWDSEDRRGEPAGEDEEDPPRA